MGIAAAAATPPSAGYVDWEEVSVSNDKGRREVHYYLKRKGGESDLAVVGKEKSLRHMSYHFVIRNRFFHASSMVKLKSRREVIDWLSSIVSDSSYKIWHSSGACRDGDDAKELDVKGLRDAQLQKVGQFTKEFTWVGSPWTCRKRRKHYQSFHRNGVRISVHDFIYVLAEEDKRLVAYLDDMYEDSRGNKMVVVRWFHKIDEVGSLLPHNFNDREVYFSLCLQDLSIECVDGLATVLSPLHFEKFINEGRHTLLDPFVCRKQFENDEEKPFDITRVRGYWKQEILRYMNLSPPPKPNLATQTSDSLKPDKKAHDSNTLRPKKRPRGSRDDVNLQCANNKESIDAPCQDILNCKIGSEVCSLMKHNSSLTVGSQVEVLSQDSGMKGCWFRASIIKKRKDRVKVQYQDIQDADDETNKLEEWVEASRVAAPDQSGLRICGRSIVRPPPQTSKTGVSSVVDMGSIVDVWWHDGWWEGIVVQKESENKLHIYFPGEKRESIFGIDDLRLSQEWVGNTWRYMKDRPDIASSIQPGLGTTDPTPVQATPLSIVDDDLQAMEVEGRIDPETNIGRVSVPDLLKDNSLSRLKWSSRKRRRNGTRSHDKKDEDIKVLGSRVFEEFCISAPVKVDQDNCKYLGDSNFTSSVVPPLTSMVMSR